MKGILGQPKFKYEDRVTFTVSINAKEEKINGDIYVVDASGTSEQQEEPSYDIEALYDGEIRLFKHVRESAVQAREDGSTSGSASSDI